MSRPICEHAGYSSCNPLSLHSFFLPSAQQVEPTGFFARVVKVALSIFHVIKEFFSWYSLAQRTAMKHFDEKAKDAHSYIEKLYFSELKSLVQGQKKKTDIVRLLQSIDYTAVQMERLTIRAELEMQHLVIALQNQTVDALLPRADQFYRTILNDLDRLTRLPSTDVQRALYTGRIVAILRQLDDAFSTQVGETLHRYCCCHIKTKEDDGGLKLLAPAMRNNNPKTVEKFLIDNQKQEIAGELPIHTSTVLLSQSYGGGHNVVQHAMSQRIAERGGHAYKLAADEEVLEPYYNYKKKTGKSGAEWAQFFLKNNCFLLIRFLGWISSGRDNVKSREAKVDRFALSLLARGKQDLSIMCFQRNTSPAEKAASRLGMGMLEIATDLDYQVFDFEKDVENPHFQHGLMARDPQKENRVLKKALYQGQIVETGFPVRDAFLKAYSPEELQAIREKYRGLHNLEPDARVVILLCGGEGVSNKIAETLVKKYPENGPKIHLFAICGKNENRKTVLEKAFQDLNRSNLRTSVFGWTNEETLGELFAMGALEQDKGLLISAKAGGGTISEAIARGIPTLASELGGIPHEKRNLDFLTDKQLGSTFKREKEVAQRVVELLTHPLQPAVSPNGEPYSDFRSKEKSMQTVAQLVEKCRKNPLFVTAKRQATATLPPATFAKLYPNTVAITKPYYKGG